jgi:hypothetical protein
MSVAIRALTLDDRIERSRTDELEFDKLRDEGVDLRHPRPFGPTRNGSSLCESGSIASGGHRTYCTCDVCF